GAPEDVVREAVETVVPGRFRFGVEDVTRAGLRAAFLRVRPGPSGAAAGARLPRSMRDLVATVDGAPLEPSIKAASRRVLERLGQAEDRTHGTEPDGASLHQLGDDDTLLDVVGVAAAIGALGIERVLVSSLPL